MIKFVRYIYKIKYFYNYSAGYKKISKKISTLLLTELNLIFKFIIINKMDSFTHDKDD